MRKARLLRLLDVIKTDPVCALHAPHALPHPLARSLQAKAGVRHEAGAALRRGVLHAPAETRALRAARARKNRAFAHAEMLSADRKRARAPVRLAENLRSILRKRVAMLRGSGCRHARLQRSKSARLFQTVLSVHLRVLLVPIRSCARPGVLRCQKMNLKQKTLRPQRMRVRAGELHSLRADHAQKASVVRRQTRRTICWGANRGFLIMY